MLKHSLTMKSPACHVLNLGEIFFEIGLKFLADQFFSRDFWNFFCPFFFELSMSSLLTFWKLLTKFKDFESSWAIPA